MELTKLDAMILNALADHGPFVEDGLETKGTDQWQDALGRLNNSSDRLARVPRTVLEKRVKSLRRSEYIEGSYRLVIFARLAVTDTGRLAVAHAASTVKTDQRREHRATPAHGQDLSRLRRFLPRA